MRSTALALGLFLTLAAPAVGYAQDEPTAADIDTARAAFQKALDLRDKQHDPQRAIEKLKAAYALVPTPRIGLEMGKTYQGMGQLTEARAAFLDVDRLPVRKNESAEARKARDDCRTMAADLDAKIPSLTIHLRGEGQVAIDSEPIRPDALAVPRRLNPGRHIVAVVVNGETQSQKIVDLREGESREMSLVAKPVGTPPEDVTTEVPARDTNAWVPPTPAGEPNTARTGVLATAYVLAGLGVVSDLIAFVVTSSAQKDHCDSVTKVCDTLSGKTTALVFGVAGDVLVGAGIITFIIGLAMPKTVTTAKTPSVGFVPVQGGGFLSVGARF